MVYMRKEIEKKVKNIIDDDSNHVVLEGELIDNNFTVMIDKEETKVIPRDIFSILVQKLRISLAQIKSI